MPLSLGSSHLHLNLDRRLALSEYGQARFSVDSQTAGKVRLTSLTSAQGLAPRLRYHLAWAIGHLLARKPADAPKEYRVTQVHGELFLRENGPAVGELRQVGPWQHLRSLAYVDEQQQDLIIDLDWFRFERLEEHRQGAALDLWV